MLDSSIGHRTLRVENGDQAESNSKKVTGSLKCNSFVWEKSKKEKGNIFTARVNQAKKVTALQSTEVGNYLLWL